MQLFVGHQLHLITPRPTTGINTRHLFYDNSPISPSSPRERSRDTYIGRPLADCCMYCNNLSACCVNCVFRCHDMTTAWLCINKPRQLLPNIEPMGRKWGCLGSQLSFFSHVRTTLCRDVISGAINEVLDPSINLVSVLYQGRHPDDRERASGKTG